jgi:hypothetical protein
VAERIGERLEARVEHYGRLMFRYGLARFSLTDGNEPPISMVPAGPSPKHGDSMRRGPAVREEFRARDLHRDFLMASIDQAEAHVAAGERATAGRLLADVTPIMTSWNLHRNALAACLVFQKALEERREPPLR